MNSLSPLLSILVTSYNQASTLSLLLTSLERQTLLREQPTVFEVIVADDGSSDDTMRLCSQQRLFPLKWVTQEDLGYRKSRILNQAIAQAGASYLLFLDADVILEQHFVADHLQLRRPGSFVCGRRVDLGPRMTAAVTEAGIQAGKWDGWSMQLAWSQFRGDSQNVKRSVRWTHAGLRRLFGYDRPIDLLGSNFSAWKEDLLSINGFNAALESYWGEDGDLYARLIHSGKKAVNAKGMCIQFHLYHPRRVPTEQNVQQYQVLLKDPSYVWAKQGYLESNS